MAMVFGLQRFFTDIRYSRERYRQFLGIAFIVLVSLVGQPQMLLYSIGASLVFVGIAIRLWASGHVKKDKMLATDGPYAYVRHPLYVGNLLLLFGFSIASGLWWSFPLLIAFLLVFYPPAIRNEDAKLSALFKEEWEAWCEKTPALMPRFSQMNRRNRGDWSFNQSLRQNGEPVIALFLISCLYVLYVWNLS